MGIGTASPATPIHVLKTQSDNTDTMITLENNTTSASGSTRISMKTNRITSSATQVPEWVLNSNGVFRIVAAGDGDGAEFELDAAGFLKVNGGYRVNATTLNVPDFVFEPGYQLRPLEEVRAFVKENRHLPDVPSVAQISTQGLDMTEMQLRLLQKVEELTLYILQQQETICGSESRLDSLTGDVSPGE